MGVCLFSFFNFIFPTLFPQSVNRPVTRSESSIFNAPNSSRTDDQLCQLSEYYLLVSQLQDSGSEVSGGSVI